MLKRSFFKDQEILKLNSGGLDSSGSVARILSSLHGFVIITKNKTLLKDAERHRDIVTLSNLDSPHEMELVY